MTVKEKWERLTELSRLREKLKHLKTSYDAVMDELETLWSKAASISAKSPDGMPHNPGYNDRMPEMFDRLDELKAKRKRLVYEALKINRLMDDERQKVINAFRGMPNKKILLLYFVDGMSYRAISIKTKTKETTVRRRIKNGVAELPEKRFKN